MSHLPRNRGPPSECSGLAFEAIIVGRHHVNEADVRMFGRPNEETPARAAAKMTTPRELCLCARSIRGRSIPNELCLH
jgi:hypothetical protein